MDYTPRRVEQDDTLIRSNEDVNVVTPMWHCNMYIYSIKRELHRYVMQTLSYTLVFIEPMSTSTQAMLAAAKRYISMLD
jgi:hypothetical protein